MKNHIFSGSLIISILIMILTSCKEKPDGIWPKMQWKYENISDGISVDEKEYTIFITKEGSLDLVCKNYKYMWFSSIEPDYPEFFPNEENNNHFKNNWCSLTINSQTIHCEFFNLNSEGDNELTVFVLAGDIGSRFRFIRMVEQIFNSES